MSYIVIVNYCKSEYEINPVIHIPITQSFEIKLVKFYIFMAQIYSSDTILSGMDF